jgi:phosphopantetheinyl transferase
MQPLFILVAEVKDRRAEFLKALSPHEQIDFRRIHAGRRADEYVAGRIAAKLLLQSETGLPLHKIEIKKDIQGRPFYRAWYVSISHSNGVAAAVIDRDPIGIDLEWVKSRRAMERIAFPEKERSNWDELSESRRAFLSTQRWTELEAIAKFKGCGLRASFSSLTRPQGTQMRQGQIKMNEKQLCWTLIQTACSTQQAGFTAR